MLSNSLMGSTKPANSNLISLILCGWSGKELPEKVCPKALMAHGDV
jgi:hypothetical protein